MWLLATMSALVVPQPFAESAASSATIQYSKFLSVGLIAIAYALTFVYKRRSHAKAWLKGVLLIMPLALVVGFAFLAFREMWTIDYSPTVISAPTVTGSEYWDAADAGLPRSEALKKHGGQVDQTWKPEGIIARKIVLAATYSLAMAAFASALIAAAQLIRISKTPR